MKGHDILFDREEELVGISKANCSNEFDNEFYLN